MKAGLIILGILVVLMLIIRYFATKEYIKVTGEKPVHGYKGPMKAKSCLYKMKHTYNKETGVYEITYDNKSSMYLNPFFIKSVVFNDEPVEGYESWIKFDKDKIPVGEETKLTIESHKEYGDLDYFMITVGYGKGKKEVNMDVPVTFNVGVEEWKPEEPKKGLFGRRRK